MEADGPNVELKVYLRFPLQVEIKGSRLVERQIFGLSHRFLPVGGDLSFTHVSPSSRAKESEDARKIDSNPINSESTSAILREFLSVAVKCITLNKAAGEERN